MKNFTLKHLSFLGLLIVSQFAFAQQNRLHYYDALFLMKNKEYVGLADSLINLDLKHSYTSDNLVMKSKVCLVNSQKDTAIHYIKEAIKYGCDFDYESGSKIIKQHLDSISLKSLKEFSRSIVYTNFQSINSYQLDDFYSLINFDQAGRNYTSRYNKGLGLDEKIMFDYELDLTRKLLKTYLETYGFPDERLFGSQLVDRFGLVVSHHLNKIDSCGFIEDAYHQAMTNEKISAHRYYHILDYFEIKRKGEQTYGEFESFKRVENKRELFRIKNVVQLDSLRETAGLCPLFVYADYLRSELPIGYTFDKEKYLFDLRKTVKDRFWRP